MAWVTLNGQGFKTTLTKARSLAEHGALIRCHSGCPRIDGHLIYHPSAAMIDLARVARNYWLENPREILPVEGGRTGLSCMGHNLLAGTRVEADRDGTGNMAVGTVIKAPYRSLQVTIKWDDTNQEVAWSLTRGPELFKVDPATRYVRMWQVRMPAATYRSNPKVLYVPNLVQAVKMLGLDSTDLLASVRQARQAGQLAKVMRRVDGNNSKIKVTA